MSEEKKKSGLQKDISSIFAGLEDIDNGRQVKPDSRPEPPSEPEMEFGRPSEAGKVRPEESASAFLRPPAAAASRLVAGGAFPKKRNSFIGLDIGPSAIKLVQAYPVPGGWEIGGYAIQELGPGGVGVSPFKNEDFARRLKRIFSETGAPRSGVVCALRNGEVVTTLVQLAQMPKNELESACRLEAGRWSSFNVEKAFLQQVPAGTDLTRPGGKFNHIVTVAGREIVGRILDVLREAGLQTVALLPIPFAWKHCLSSILLNDESSATAVVDVGSARTLVAIYKGSEVRFSREFETGGIQITEAILGAAKTFGVTGRFPREEAERIKQSVNLFSDGGGHSVKDNLTAAQVGGMVRPVLEKIVQESKRSFDYYRQLYRQEEVGRVYISGGASLMPGFVKFFKERVRQPVESLDFPDKLKLHSSIGSGEEFKKIFPRLSRATALALSRKWEVNFIPPLDKILQNILRRKVLIIVPALALILVSYIFYRSIADLIPVHERLVEQQQSELAAIEAELSSYRILEALQGQLAARKQAGIVDLFRQPNWKGVLKEFSRITPSNVVLTGIMTLPGEGPRRILCNGRVIDSTDDPGGGVTRFVVRVENSPFFREVEKISEDMDRGTFSFSCTLVY